jgi:type I restriction-modification system DNA methylase subunit
LERTSEDGSDLALHIERIFDTLNKPPEKRSKAIDEQLNKFPYVDGGIFAERLSPADFTSKMRRVLLESCSMDWGKIKPEIFGAMFQNVMDKEKRRALGEHYTIEENIKKLIKPLFLDSLQEEFENIKKIKSAEKRHRLLTFHDKLCRLKFLDPACGCGNFLIVSYRALRLLEIDVIRELLKGEQVLDIELMIRVNVDQFYGIEIEEFPVQVARTAMWLMDHLMNNEASSAFGKYIVRIPLTTSAKSYTPTPYP